MFTERRVPESRSQRPWRSTELNDGAVRALRTRASRQYTEGTAAPPAQTDARAELGVEGESQNLRLHPVHTQFKTRPRRQESGQWLALAWGRRGCMGLGWGQCLLPAMLSLHLGWWLQRCCPFANIPGAKFTTHALLSVQAMLNGKFYYGKYTPPLLITSARI